MLSTSYIHINSLLFNHFRIGTGASGYLRGKIPGLSYYLNSFFNSRSDIERLQQAQFLSEHILSLTDFQDLIPLRSQVATMEIKRLIEYKRQTDHTAHTLYLYLLGIWFYDNIPEIRQAVDDSISSSKPVKMFLFHWTFASLLHDVGYLYYDFEEGQNRDSWRIFDEMLSIDYIKQFAGDLTPQAFVELQELHSTFVKRYGVTDHANLASSEQLIKMLDNIPWLADLLPSYQSGLESMKSIHNIGPGLSEFAYQMAKKGYDGYPVVDHGVASGLILLKYTSIWYWLSKNSEEPYPLLHEELNARFGYYPKVLEKHVVPACKAVSYHNMPNVKFNLYQEPVLYLAVLCDELQIWDRFFSGSEHIDKWSTVDHCMSEKIRAELIFSESNTPMIHLMSSNNHYTKLLSNLEKRVEQWDSFVQLSNVINN